MWERNLLQGFVARLQAEELLRYVGRNTLCVRFSDSDHGVLTVGYIPDQPSANSAVAWTKISPETLRHSSIVDILLTSKIPRIVDTQGNAIPCNVALTESEAFAYSSIVN